MNLFFLKLYEILFFFIEINIRQYIPILAHLVMIPYIHGHSDLIQTVISYPKPEIFR